MDPIYYYDIYLLIVSISSILAFNGTFWENSISTNRLFLIILTISFVLFIGFRPISYVFADTGEYDLFYRMILGDPFVFTLATDNFIFDNVFHYLASIRLDVRFFFVLIAFLYFVNIAVASKQLFPRFDLHCFLVYLAAFSTFSYGTNGLKAGVAASLFLVAIAYKKNRLISFLFLIMSLGFHHSMVLPIVAFCLVTFLKKTKIYLLGWLCCLLISAAHISFFQTFFADFTDEQGAGYLLSDGSDWGGQTGFRFDFVIYSAMPVIMGYWVIIKQKIESDMYQFLLNLYLVTNSVWMLCMYANFTNRIAYLSWFLYPFVLIYPLLNLDIIPDQYKLLKKVVFAHLGFTLFMHFIYY